MKTIGLLGGMSWESTTTYYQLMNEAVNAKLGALNSAKILLHSVNFEEMVTCQKASNWELAGRILGEAGRGLEQAGADMLLICTNTMHILADRIQSRVSIPLVHIVDVTGDTIESHDIHKVGLLGTRYTMEQPFYRERLVKRGIEVITPDEAGRTLVHNVIFDELCKGIIREESRTEYLNIMHQLMEQGAEGIILGCTEIPLLIQPCHTSIPLFDSTRLHAERAVALALA